MKDSDRAKIAAVMAALLFPSILFGIFEVIIWIFMISAVFLILW